MTTLEAPLPPQHPSAKLQGIAVAFEDVHLKFRRKPVLDGISFELQRGETKLLLGVAGSGKTTILKLALGLLKPDSGRIWVLGEEVTRMKEEELFALRPRVGMVFQESALFDSLRVRQNVGYRLFEEKEVGKVAGVEIDRRVQEALRFVELENTIGMFPSELSGGMRRRVAIARAIIAEPELLLYDSPTAGLDPVTSTTIIELIVKQRDFFRTSALLVTHRIQDAFIMATHTFDAGSNRMRPLASGQENPNTTFLILRDGKVLFDGTAQELARSDNEYIREYLS